MELVDTHCHLTFKPLAPDTAGVIERAAKRGVTRIVAPAYDPGSWTDVAALGRFDGVFLAFGVHPWVARSAFSLEELEKFLMKHNAVAVGEIGLDFKIASPDRDRQISIFKDQLNLAATLSLPVMLHCRGAFEEMLEILSEFQGALTGVIHAFHKGPKMCERFIDAGMHVSFGGSVTRPRAKQAKRSVAMVREDRFLLETDAPAIGLDGVEPEKTEPGHVVEIAAAVAELRGESIEHVAALTTENAKRLFRFDAKGDRSIPCVARREK